MKKNKLLLSAITLLIFILSSCGGGTDNNSNNNENREENPKIETEENKTTTENTVDDKIKYIKEKFSEIEKNISNYEKKDALFSGTVGEEGQEYYVHTEWLAFYNGDKITKLVESTGEEGYWAEISYYYDNGKLFFIFHELEFDGYPIEESRIYIYDGKIIDALTKSVDEMSEESLSDVKNQKYDEVLTGELKDMYLNWEKNAMEGFLENVDK